MMHGPINTRTTAIFAYIQHFFESELITKNVAKNKFTVPFFKKTNSRDTQEHLGRGKGN
jgi:hypothetical protein